MIRFVLILAASNYGVQSQRCATTPCKPCPDLYNPFLIQKNPYESPPILPCDFYQPQTVVPNVATVLPIAAPETVYARRACSPEIALPIAVLETALPVTAFITDLPNCPDVCFKDILTSPLGCLDPILSIYGIGDVCPLPDLPVSPILPAGTAMSALAPSFNKLLPPVCDCEFYTRFLGKATIPPPFI